MTEKPSVYKKIVFVYLSHSNSNFNIKPWILKLVTHKHIVHGQLNRTLLFHGIAETVKTRS